VPAPQHVVKKPTLDVGAGRVAGVLEGVLCLVTDAGCVELVEATFVGSRLREHLLRRAIAISAVESRDLRTILLRIVKQMLDTLI
jgi:hypothetical protein